MIPQPYRDNFNSLQRAFDAGDACLLECHEQATGKPAYVLCAVNRRDEQYELVPFAQLFDDNPFERLVPPEESKASGDTQVTGQAIAADHSEKGSQS